MAEPAAPQTPAPPSSRARLLRRVAVGVAALVLLYLVVAYVLVPLVWVRYAHRHPA